VAAALYRGLVMKSAKILVSVVLIPALLVASGESVSDSVQKLLRKPRYGETRIAFADGTQTAGAVSRVTNQFITLREANRCRNVEAAQIASVKWLPNQSDSLEDTLTGILMVVITSPIWIPWMIAYALGHRDETSPLSGNWESTSTSPDGKMSRVEGSGNILVQRSVIVAKGRYEVIGQDLHLTYDGSGLAETIPVEFDCDSLILGAQKLLARFSTTRAQAPIVGRWFPERDRRSFWEFIASGAFEKRISESQVQGQIRKIKGGVRVKWLGPDAKPDEDWAIRSKAAHLFITAGGVTTEYVRADY
jgi:hypothetical protein